jgi:anti-anti-sigma regulatory factor
MQLPETFNPDRARNFLRELESRMDASRPRIVLDCSNVRELGKPTIHLLLCCLEEAMKRNGDIRLAAIPTREATVFDFSELNRLFEVFDTTAGAVSSFQQLSMERILQKYGSVGSHNPTVNRT